MVGKRLELWPGLRKIVPLVTKIRSVLRRASSIKLSNSSKQTNQDKLFRELYIRKCSKEQQDIIASYQWFIQYLLYAVDRVYVGSTLIPADYEDLAIEYMLRGDLLDEMLRQGRNYRFFKALGRRVVADDFETLGIPPNDFLAARYVEEIVHDLILMDVI